MYTSTIANFKLLNNISEWEVGKKYMVVYYTLCLYHKDTIDVNYYECTKIVISSEFWTFITLVLSVTDSIISLHNLILLRIKLAHKLPDILTIALQKAALAYHCMWLTQGHK